MMRGVPSRSAIPEPGRPSTGKQQQPDDPGPTPRPGRQGTPQAIRPGTRRTTPPARACRPVPSAFPGHVTDDRVMGHWHKTASNPPDARPLWYVHARYPCLDSSAVAAQDPSPATNHVDSADRSSPILAVTQKRLPITSAGEARDISGVGCQSGGPIARALLPMARTANRQCREPNAATNFVVSAHADNGAKPE